MTEIMWDIEEVWGVSIPTAFASRGRREGALRTSGTPPTARGLQMCSWCTVAALESLFGLFMVRTKISVGRTGGLNEVAMYSSSK